MRKKFVYILIILVAIIIQTSIIPAVSQSGKMGNVVLMAVLAFAVLDGFFSFLPWVVAAGLLYDLISFFPFGMHVFIFLPILYFVSFFSRRLTVEAKGVGIILFMGFSVFATIFAKAIYMLSMSWQTLSWQNYWKTFDGFYSLLWQITFNIILFFIWFLIIKKVKKFFTIR